MDKYLRQWQARDYLSRIVVNCPERKGKACTDMLEFMRWHHRNGTFRMEHFHIMDGRDIYQICKREVNERTFRQAITALETWMGVRQETTANSWAVCETWIDEEDMI